MKISFGVGAIGLFEDHNLTMEYFLPFKECGGSKSILIKSEQAEYFRLIRNILNGTLGCTNVYWHELDV